MNGLAVYLNKDLGSITLSGVMGVEQANALKGGLEELMRSSNRIEIHDGGLEEVDVFIIQVICAAHRTALRLGKQLFVMARPGSPLTTEAQALGIKRRGGCKSVSNTTCVWS